MIIKRLLTHNYLLATVVVYTAALLVLSLWRFIAFDPIPIKNGDKIGHFIAYFGCTVVWFGFCFYSKKNKIGFNKSLGIASIIAILFGLLMEVAQGMLTDYRMPDYVDAIANTSGTILAAVIIRITKKTLCVLKSE